MAYIGTIKERMNMVVTLVGDYEYCTCYGYSEQTNHIYRFNDDDGNEIVWKTTSVIGKHGEDEKGYDNFTPIHKGDKVEIKATVKAHSLYRDKEQTVITRTNVIDIIEKALTQEEKEEIKQAEQIESLTGDDFIYTMPYRQYKEHYADCELLAGSWNERERTVGVIVREGRLKKSGVRGEHYSGYRFQNENGEQVVYRAVCEENALKRANKEFPNHTWECTKVYDYR